MNFKYLSETQNALLEMAKIIDQKCRENNITYWICTGTVLGAVRNKGFIEWDDDLDMCFPVGEYDKLINILREEVVKENPHYILYNDHRPHAHYSEYLADTRIMSDHLYPIKIDLVKVKSIPNTPEAIQNDVDRVNLYAYIFGKKKELKIENKSLVEEHLYKGSFWFKRERYLKNFIAYVNGLDQIDESHVYENIYNDIFFSREVNPYNYEDLFPLQELEFEGVKFFAPKNTDKYLSNLYGKNYIIPPPEDKRKPYSKSLGPSKVSPFIAKKLIWTLYFLKAVKGSFTLPSKIKKLKAKGY
ncbi:LicD family protein [Brumimicrobium aurantiacum]|uniref:LicD/FKTN/FKRP nucleotidyltransferase domain-containing protein n=1 Tax=Brumimicrobium aurantiacum TaxID=1737063 RepID=A0A3E1EZP7_9FLAO|nr:LicD family protein [Brumimicrobium aurantiacum]RFC55026.1 hypothetical protein DXU93_04175 [Brumimicrobium aurantiacum]